MGIPIESFESLKVIQYPFSLSRFGWLTTNFQTSYTFTTANFDISPNNCKVKTMQRDDPSNLDFQFCTVIYDTYTNSIYIKFLNNEFKIAYMGTNEEYSVALMVLHSLNGDKFTFYGTTGNPFNDVYKEIFSF